MIREFFEVFGFMVLSLIIICTWVFVISILISMMGEGELEVRIASMVGLVILLLAGFSALVVI